MSINTIHKFIYGCLLKDLNHFQYTDIIQPWGAICLGEHYLWPDVGWCHWTIYSQQWQWHHNRFIPVNALSLNGPTAPVSSTCFIRHVTCHTHWTFGVNQFPFSWSCSFTVAHWFLSGSSYLNSESRQNLQGVFSFMPNDIRVRKEDECTDV